MVYYGTREKHCNHCNHSAFGSPVTANNVVFWNGEVASGATGDGLPRNGHPNKDGLLRRGEESASRLADEPRTLEEVRGLPKQKHHIDMRSSHVSQGSFFAS